MDYHTSTLLPRFKKLQNSANEFWSIIFIHGIKTSEAPLFCGKTPKMNSKVNKRIGAMKWQE